MSTRVVLDGSARPVGRVALSLAVRNRVDSGSYSDRATVRVVGYVTGVRFSS